MDVTARVHGPDATRVAADASKLVFDRSADPREFSAGVLESLMLELPAASVTLGAAEASVTAADGTVSSVAVKNASDGAGVDVLDAFVATGLVKSKGDARRLLQQGGLYANGEKIAADRSVLTLAGAIHGQYYVLRKGAREMAIVRFA
jgi:tyrosyl-tRNA synthetase